MQTKNLGIVAPVPKGDWSASQSYDRLNIVRNNNASYIALQSNIAVEPAVTQGWENSWMLIASDGAQGPVGPQGTTNYNNLENLPIFNVDLTTLATPVENEYYRHTGTTDTQFINSCIYRYDGTQFIILGDLDKSIADETYSNALKGYVGGTSIRLDGVSPLQSSVEVQVSGVSNPESVTVSRYGKNLIPFPYKEMSINAYDAQMTAQSDGGIVVSGIPTGPTTLSAYIGKPFSISGKMYASLQGEFSGVVYQITIAPAANPTNYIFNVNTVQNALIDLDEILSGTNYSADELILRITIKRQENSVEMSGTVYPQVELGDTATAYEKYIQPTTYTPDSNGNVEIPALRPTMTLLTNNASANLSATYNRDINAAINGTTETQPLATIDYVNAAVANVSPKLYKHLFNLDGNVGSAIAEVYVCFEIIDSLETAIVDLAYPIETLRPYLVNKYGVNKAIPVSGYVTIRSDDTINLIYFPALSIVADNSKVSVNYLKNEQLLSASLNQIALYGDNIETIIEI